MPRVKLDQAPAPSGEQNWQEAIAERIRKGKVVPIVSNRLANHHVLGGHEALVDAYLAYASFPLARQHFSQMLQFRAVADERMRDGLAIKEDYVNFVKNRLFDLAEADGATAGQRDEAEAQFDDVSFSVFCDLLGYPRFSGRDDLFLLLANFDLPIYVTTSYHDVLEKALRTAGKAPQRAICRWHDNISAQQPDILDADFTPTPQTPLVFHLYGIDEAAGSMVLTEDDYLRFLVNAAASIGGPTDPVPKLVRQAMSDSSLLLLGYELASWEMRALFWGLIEPRAQKLAGAISIQVEPSEQEKRYLQRYYTDDRKFDVFVGEVHAALTGIFARLG